MSDAERRSLLRAAVLLLVVSFARWGWASSRPPIEAAAPDLLPALLEESTRRAGEAAARSEPLRDGERIDPNRAPERELDRLPGVGPATAAAIVRERRERGGFWSAEDLTRVRGIGPATVERIRPHLDFGARVPVELPGGRRPPRAVTEPRIDVNRADHEALQQLPGVGPALARRIIEARRDGRFRTVDDLARVRGIGSATVERLRTRAMVGPGRR